MGAFFGAWGADRTGSWVGGVLIGMAAGAMLALVHAFFSIHLRADQIVSGTAVNFLALGITGYFYINIYGNNGTPNNLSGVPDVNLSWLGRIPPHGLGAFGAALLFGFASAVAPRLENVEGWANYGTLFQALPYVLTLVAVAGVIGRSIPPAAVGRPYEKQ